MLRVINSEGPVPAIEKRGAVENEITLKTIKIDAFQIQLIDKSYLINGRPKKNGSILHACSPQIINVGNLLPENKSTDELGKKTPNIPFESVVYFISCDFRGKISDEYTPAKLEAVKAYLDTLEKTFKTPYKVVVCDVLPRHNWKTHLRKLRTQNISMVEFESLVRMHIVAGDKADEIFALLQSGENRDVSLGISDEYIEQRAWLITLAANRKFLNDCRELFTDAKTMAWEMYLDILPAEFLKHKYILDECKDAILESAEGRGGCVEDTIIYKQEELVVGLHIAEGAKGSIGLYNRYTSVRKETGHMEACIPHGHMRIFDIRFCDEIIITQTVDAILYPEGLPLKLKLPEKQLAALYKVFPDFPPSEKMNAIEKLFGLMPDDQVSAALALFGQKNDVKHNNSFLCLQNIKETFCTAFVIAMFVGLTWFAIVQPGLIKAERLYKSDLKDFSLYGCLFLLSSWAGLVLWDLSKGGSERVTINEFTGCFIKGCLLFTTGVLAKILFDLRAGECDDVDSSERTSLSTIHSASQFEYYVSSPGFDLISSSSVTKPLLYSGPLYSAEILQEPLMITWVDDEKDPDSEKRVFDTKGC